jgi:hypothetical protein
MKWLTCYQGMLDLRATLREGVRRYTRACGKEPVQGRRLDRRLNVGGDGQGDLSGHRVDENPLPAALLGVVSGAEIPFSGRALSSAVPIPCLVSQ